MTDLLDKLPAALREALDARGFETLTSVQEAVLEVDHAARDLRISSQTGSGKTLALAFAIAPLLADPPTPPRGVAKPVALILVPTRELCAQVCEELTWSLKGLGVRVAKVSGGASYKDENRALAQAPQVVVATPGRLMDQMEQRAIDTSAIRAVAMDEADEMLDLGFREALETILAQLPTERRTHLVSATFPREVVRLADRYQKDPIHVEGTRLGAANVDIEHVLMLVDAGDRTSAIINLLLSDPDVQTLVFVRMRADVSELSHLLHQAGFACAGLSGEMAQGERTRALAAFKDGTLRVLVATDVAARGIDVQIGRVIHADPPGNAETYTHRSGRTGRAGRKGESVMFVQPSNLYKARGQLRRAGVEARIAKVPDPKSILRAADDRMHAQILEEAASDAPVDRRLTLLAERLLRDAEAQPVVEALLKRTDWAGPTAPRTVREIQPPVERDARGPMRDVRGHDDARGPLRAPREHEAPRPVRGEDDWVPFHINWGEKHGADPRRLLALVCRRGGIRGDEVGAIRIDPAASLFQVAVDVAEAFAIRARRPDARDPGLHISPYDPERTRAPRPTREPRPAPGPAQAGTPQAETPRTAHKPAHAAPKPPHAAPKTGPAAPHKPSAPKPPVGGGRPLKRKPK